MKCDAREEEPARGEEAASAASARLSVFEHFSVRRFFTACVRPPAGGVERFIFRGCRELGTLE